MAGAATLEPEVPGLGQRALLRLEVAPALVGLAAGLAISVAARGLVESRLEQVGKAGGRLLGNGQRRAGICQLLAEVTQCLKLISRPGSERL